MKKFSAVLVSVLVFVSVFSICAGAANETRTEKFFAEIEESKAVTFYEPMQNEDMGGFSYGKTSIRYTEDGNGENITEYFASAKLWFIDLEMYATQKGLFLYFPQFNRHIDFSLIWEDEANDILADLLYEESELMPLPSYPQYMSLKSSVEETNVAGYGVLYTETFTYDTEAVVKDLVSKDIIPDPAHYGISLDDNRALSEFYWNYAGDFSGFAASLLYENKATFTFDEKGRLVAADYFTGEGRDIDSEYYELGELGSIAAGASAEDFEMPESSKNLDVISTLIRFYLKLLVK